MEENADGWRTVIVGFLLAYLVASMTAVLAVLVFTFDPETIPAGLLAPLFLVPSILGFLVFERVLLSQKARGVYIVPAVGFVVFWAVSLFYSWIDNDIVGVQISQLVLVIFGTPAIITYWFLVKFFSRGKQLSQ